ncbi:MAG: Stp1/IreP family PP2C-type Ser/Thr phosphatase [Candidatus Hydrogenedentes bacterium]|nr:Stp1/IreP family PP2C-type Ser/Thr phosphatase [Candidatus Hydrogenedentota bacterium]
MRLDIAAQSDIGRRKKKNEDSFGIFREGDSRIALFKEGALLTVADGLGGHMGGDIASKLAVSIIQDALKETPNDDDDDVEEKDEGPLPILRKYIIKANDSIFQTNRDQVRTRRPMGTTLLTAVITPKKVYIGNIGDSRAYHMREGEIIAHTEDHSWVDEQVKLGLMSKAEAEMDRRKNIVTRCVGTHEEVVVDTYRWHIVPGDMILLCTDGLVNMVPDADIREQFQKKGTAAEIVQRLVHLANENGGKDNVTVIVASISPNPMRLVYMRTSSFFRRNGFTLGWLFFLLFYGIAAAAAGYILRPFFPPSRFF